MIVMSARCQIGSDGFDRYSVANCGGPRGLEQGRVEVKHRKSGKIVEISPQNAVEMVRQRDGSSRMGISPF